MPKRKKEEVLDYLDSYAFRILKAITEDEPFYVNIMKKSGLVRSNFNRRLNELLELGLINVKYVKDPNSRIRRPRALYYLTPLGKRIFKLLEKIVQTYKE